MDNISGEIFFYISIRKTTDSVQDRIFLISANVPTKQCPFLSSAIGTITCL